METEDKPPYVTRLRSKKRKLLKFEANQVANNGDKEWHEYFQSALQSDPKLDYQDIACFTYSENGIDFEVTVQEQHRYVSFLSQIPEVYGKVKQWPNARQQMLILAIAACVSANQKNFLQLNTSGTYASLVTMAEVIKPTTDCLVKIRYMDMLCSFLEHDAGLKWSLETNYWMEIYELVIDCQNDKSCITKKAHNILSKFLQKTLRIAPKICIHVIKQMVQSLVHTSARNFSKTKKQPVELLTLNDSKMLLPKLTCLVETLERLLATPATDILKYFVKMQVREASETLAVLSNDSNFSLQVDKIVIILSFYEMTDLFDGIKVVNHDPIALSGFLKIVERELRKNHLKIIFELYYYAQKYWKNVSRKMPQYFLKGKAIDIEDELMSFQIEPLVIIAEKLLGVPQTHEEELRDCYLADILNVYSTDGLQLGYEIREKLNTVPLDVEITALQCLIKSKPMYCRKNLAVVFQSLTYALRDFIKYVSKHPEIGQMEHDHLFADMLLEAILAYLENFDLSWRESIGRIEMSNLVYEFLMYSSRWPAEVLLKALKTLNITILKHMCPNMALLVDTGQNTSFNDLGSMLFKNCFSSNPEVRNAALTVVCTVCQKVNQGFTSFKQILEESLTKDLILTMSMTDFDWSVRATALRCLKELIIMEDIGESLYQCEFVDKILQLISKDQEPAVLKEAINVVSQIYQCDKNTEADNFRIYNVMVKVALREGNPEVQEKAIKFWDRVTRKNLERQGMTDDAFPTVIFSKEQKKIIRMDDKEIRKRLFKTLDAISKSGCFGVFQKILQNDNSHKQVLGTAIATVTKLLRLLQQYEVTPEFILFNQAYPNLWSLTSSTIQSPSGMEDENMKDIVEETLMEMINGELNTNKDSSIHTSSSSSNNIAEIIGDDVNSECAINQVSTVDFIDFIYRKLPHLVN
ncbi:uncharacterized protein [Euwallacea fornicatus]|uniref:uncharacterized protein isoform X1 n=1 Tax=Euwallacea fornicatus TaxID=995702 RepID=UPI00338F589E